MYCEHLGTTMQGMEPLTLHSLTLWSTVRLLLISYCWPLTTPRTSALEQGLFMFVHVSRGFQGSPDPPELGGGGSASQQLCGSGLPTLNQSCKASSYQREALPVQLQRLEVVSANV